MFQITRLWKKLLSLIDIAKRDEVDIVSSGSSYKDKTTKRSLSKNFNKVIGYLTPKTRLAFTK